MDSNEQSQISKRIKTIEDRLADLKLELQTLKQSLQPPKVSNAPNPPEQPEKYCRHINNNYNNYKPSKRRRKRAKRKTKTTKNTPKWLPKTNRDTSINDNKPTHAFNNRFAENDYSNKFATETDIKHNNAENNDVRFSTITIPTKITNPIHKSSKQPIQILKPPPKQSSKMSNDICWDYLSSKGCNRANCNWRHVAIMDSQQKQIAKQMQSQWGKQQDKNREIQQKKYKQNTAKIIERAAKHKKIQKFMQIDHNICWEFNTVSGCSKGKNCAWKHVTHGKNTKRDKHGKIIKNNPVKFKKSLQQQTYERTMKTVNELKSEMESKNEDKIDKNMYVIIVINSKDLYVGEMSKEKTKEIYSKCNKFTAGKHNKGGQSAQRFGRIYENKINCFIKDCAEKIVQILVNFGEFDVVIIGGNGNTKNKLVANMKQINRLNQNELKKLKTVKTCHGGKQGFDEIVQRLKGDLRERLRNQKDIELIGEINQMVKDQEQCHMVSIGINETVKAVSVQIVKCVVVVEGVYKYAMKKKSNDDNSKVNEFILKFVRNDLELNELVKEMEVDLSDKNKKWEIMDFMEYIKELCEVNKITLNVVINDCEIVKAFMDDLSGCVGILHQSAEYLLESEQVSVDSMDGLFEPKNTKSYWPHTYEDII